MYNNLIFSGDEIPERDIALFWCPLAFNAADGGVPLG